MTKSTTIPIIRVGDALIVAMRDIVREADVNALLDDLDATFRWEDARGVIFDLSAIETVDSFLGRVIGDIVTMTRLVGVESVVVGMRPPIAITLVELGLELKGVRAALTIEKGLNLLGRGAAGGDGRAREHHDGS
jgi:rsbT antagonist protein RsbS